MGSAGMYFVQRATTRRKGTKPSRKAFILIHSSSCPSTVPLVERGTLASPSPTQVLRIRHRVKGRMRVHGIEFALQYYSIATHSRDTSLQIERAAFATYST